MKIDIDEIRRHHPELLSFALHRYVVAGKPPNLEPVDWVHRAILELLQELSIPCSAIAWLKMRILQLSTNEARSRSRQEVAARQIRSENRVAHPDRDKVAADLVRRAMVMLGLLATETNQVDLQELLEVYKAEIYTRSDVAEVLGVTVQELDRRRAALRRLLSKLPSGLRADIADFLEHGT